MNLRAIVEDAFLSCLEEGADPPAAFVVRLPWASFHDVADEGNTLKIAGYVLTLKGCDVIDQPVPMSWWTH